MFRKICVLGCGLIGSSLLRAIDKKKLAKEICAYDKSKEVSLYLAKNLPLILIVFLLVTGITIDILKSAEESDLIILASGDGDFDLLLKEIKVRYNTNAEVFGVKDLTANSLIRETKTFIPINGSLLLR